MFREPGSSKMSELSASGRDYSGVVGSGLGSLGGPRPEPWFPGLWLRWAPGGRPGGGAGGFRVGGGGGRGAGEAERAPALFSPEPALRDRGSGGDDSMGGPRAWTLLCLGLLLPGGGAAWSVPGARFSGRR